MLYHFLTNPRIVSQKSIHLLLCIVLQVFEIWYKFAASSQCFIKNQQFWPCSICLNVVSKISSSCPGYLKTTYAIWQGKIFRGTGEHHPTARWSIASLSHHLWMWELLVCSWPGDANVKWIPMIFLTLFTIQKGVDYQFWIISALILLCQWLMNKEGGKIVFKQFKTSWKIEACRGKWSNDLLTVLIMFIASAYK